VVGALLDELGARVLRDDAWSDGEVLEWANRWRRAEGRGAVASLAALPPVTTDVFRYGAPRALRAAPRVTFRTSGTTAHLRGEHHLTRTDVYRTVALRAFRELIGARWPLRRLVALVPPPSLVPDSSLSHMLGDFAEALFPGDATRWVVGPRGLELGALREALAEAGRSGEPTLLFATTLAAFALLESGGDVGGALPDGSVVLTTGGAKSHRRAVDPAAVERELGARFPGAAVGAEYGMTELLSQAYRVGPAPFVFPPWCRVLAMDPARDEPVGVGEVGLLRVIDLANMESAIAVQTADWVECAGPRAFHFRGRASGAVLRGCSVTYEELAGEGGGAAP
jgi:hypothetical protein